MGFIKKNYKDVSKMFNFFKVKEIEKDDQSNSYLLTNMKQYNIGFYKFAGNILSENNDIYNKLNDNSFPRFDISKITKDIFQDVINEDFPFLSLFRYDYFENIINENLKYTNAFKYLKDKEISLLKSVNHGGRHKDLADLFDSNLANFFLKVDELIKVKMFNNCLANYENEKYGYGVKTENEGNYFEKQIVKYYFYFSDSIVSAATIAYLMSLSVKINSLKEHKHEFYIIIENMLKETSDIELVYKKGYELLENLYSQDFHYLEDINAFKIFVKMINSSNFINKDGKLNEYLNKFSQLKPSYFLRKAAVDQLYMNDDQLKNVIAYLMKNSSFESMNSLFKELGQINSYIDNYKSSYTTSKLSQEKEQYLKGDFSNLKAEENNKQSLENIHTGTEFEKYLVKLFKDMGYETEHTGKAGDQGCDLLIKKNDKTYCIQAKYYTSDLDNTPVQEIIGSLKYYNGNQGIVITNSSFTSGAYELARSNNVILIDGRKLQKLINYLYSDNDVNRDILEDIDYL